MLVGDVFLQKNSNRFKSDTTSSKFRRYPFFFFFLIIWIYWFSGLVFQALVILLVQKKLSPKCCITILLYNAKHYPAK